MALSVVGTLRGRLLARDAVSNKGKRASARNTMAPANQSSAAATFRNNAAPYHAGARLSGRRHTLKYLYLRPNSRQHLAPRSCTHLARTSEHQLARTSEHHKPSTSKNEELAQAGKSEELAQAGKSEELAQAGKGEELARQGRHHKPRRTSRHHTRPARVGITNPGAQFFILKAANPRMIRRFYGVQFFISEKPISSTFVLLCGKAHSRMDLPLRYAPSRV